MPGISHCRTGNAGHPCREIQKEMRHQSPTPVPPFKIRMGTATVSPAIVSQLNQPGNTPSFVIAAINEPEPFAAWSEDHGLVVIGVREASIQADIVALTPLLDLKFNLQVDSSQGVFRQSDGATIRTISSNLIP